MIREYSFRYFPDYEKWAGFAESSCECKESGKTHSAQCLLGVYFETASAPDLVCIEDLVSGKVRVYIGDYIRIELKASIETTYPNWSEDQVIAQIEKAVDELSRTPPVPWTQSNAWAIHHGDFCRYLGEWQQEQFNQMDPLGDGLAYLMSTIREPDGIGDPQALWESIGMGVSTIYMFECPTCKRLISIDQSY